MDRFDSPADIGFLKSGDLVLSAAAGSWRRRMPWSHRGSWTHVGLVVRHADDAEPLLWDGMQPGGALVPLARRIAHVRGRIGVRCLNRPLDAAQCEQLETLHRSFGRPPEHQLMDLIAAADGSWLGSRSQHLGVPCDAELVATVYQQLGLLDDVEAGGRPPSRFRPRHFGGSYRLELKNRYALGPEIVLREPAHEAGWSAFRPQPV